MAITRNVGEEVVNNTFHNNQDVLVGMFDSNTRKAGSYIAPRTSEAELKTPATGLLTSSRSTQVAKQALSSLPWGYDASKASVCVLHPIASFDPNKPKAPSHHILTFDTKTSAYTPCVGRDIDTLDQSLWTLKEVFAEAENEFITALDKGASFNHLDTAFAKYEVARRNFEAALQYREYLVSQDDSLFSEFFGNAQSFAVEHSSEMLFTARAPQTSENSSEGAEAKANRCIRHYEDMQKFFANQGRYCSNDVKEKLLGSAIFNLSDALKAAPSAKASFSRNTHDFLEFSTTLRQYSHPLSNAQFRKELVKFLFDPKATTPSEALQRAVANNPGQKKKLEEMAAVKQEVTGSTKNLIKRGVRGTILGFYDLQNAIASKLSDRRFIGVEEIIRNALNKSEGWLPSRPFEDFLPDDEAELTELTTLAGINPGEEAARREALVQLAYRVRRHGEQAFQRLCHQNLTLDACLTHAAKSHTFEDSSAYFNKAKDSLEENVYGRLQRLGEMDSANPGDEKTHFWNGSSWAPWTSNQVAAARKIWVDYKDLEDKVDDQLTPAVNKLYFELMDASREPLFAPVSGAPNDRYSSLVNDVRWVQDALPSFERTPPGRAVTYTDYPHMENTNKVNNWLEDLATTVEQKIQADRGARPIDTPAHRLNTIAATTQEIKALLDGFASVTLTAATLDDANLFRDDAQTKFHDAQLAVGEAQFRLQEDLIKVLPNQRGPHMRALYETFTNLRDALAVDITTQRTVDDLQIALDAATAACTALEEAAKA